MVLKSREKSYQLSQSNISFGSKPLYKILNNFTHLGGSINLFVSLGITLQHIINNFKGYQHK